MGTVWKYCGTELEELSALFMAAASTQPTTAKLATAKDL